jgi:hypothetical protein
MVLRPLYPKSFGSNRIRPLVRWEILKQRQGVKRWRHLWGYVSREMAAKRVNQPSWAQKK